MQDKMPNGDAEGQQGVMGVGLATSALFSYKLDVRWTARAATWMSGPPSHTQEILTSCASINRKPNIQHILVTSLRANTALGAYAGGGSDRGRGNHDPRVGKPRPYCIVGCHALILM
jgi:hypothetical protein